jgi:hypothetical protein
MTYQGNDYGVTVKNNVCSGFELAALANPEHPGIMGEHE